MTWEPELEELRRRRELAAQMGGPDKIGRQRAAGRLTVRERIDVLLDPGSFREIGGLAGAADYDESGELKRFRAANFVMGRGRIDGRRIVVGGDDFTVRGGAADAAIYQKQVYAEQMAQTERIPIVRLVDGTGGGGSVKSLETMGRTYVPFNPGFEVAIANLATVPVVALALGPVAGLGAARVVMSHYSVMVRGIAQVFVAGPPVVAGLGERVDKETLGGADVHARNGVVDDEAESEAAAFDRARRFLSYLPSSVYDLPPRIEGGDDPARADEALLSAVPRERRTPYDMRAIIASVCDRGSVFEMARRFGTPAITALARLDGCPVAVLANDPRIYAGGWNAAASQKVARFIDFAETFHLPLVHLVDQPGFVIGSAAERAATIRHGARALAAIYQATVPWCSVIVRKAYGVAGAAHQNHARFNVRYAWPSGDWGSLPLEGGIEAAYRADLEAADDPAALLAEIRARMDAVRSPFRTAEAFLIEEIIDPRDTRRLLCEFAVSAAGRLSPGPRGWGMRP
ncbi:MAG TPA: carboxyl transferase domain-containing protein [Actinomycetota bacterium]|nr:carboxyl transferase domain-containing protein [Actinomycetota bacterium]